jgi:hypothetical protein
MTHGKIEGVHGKDFVGFSEMTDIRKEVVGELESDTKA